MTPDPTAIDAIIVTGPVGSGKTTIARELSELLRHSGVSHGFVDADQVRSFYPEAPNDPFNQRIAMKNISAISSTYIEAGAQWLVFADVIEHDGHRRAYARAIPRARIVVVRLDVDMEQLEVRLQAREAPERVDWYLRRAPELQELMVRNQVGDLVIAAGSRPRRAIAEEILQALNIA